MEDGMAWSRVAGLLSTAVALALLGGCSKGSPIDWSAKENFLIVEKSEPISGGARLEMHSLVDAPAKAVYDALADVENYSKFVDGVTESALVSSHDNIKIIQIAQTVIGRQAHAEVQWTLYPEQMKIEFRTLKSDANYNDGTYTVTPSPDGKRSYVISVYDVKEKGAPQNVPIGVLKTATRDGFEKAARSVKRRA